MSSIRQGFMLAIKKFRFEESRPATVEADLQKECVKLFRARLKRTVWFHVPNGEHRAKSVAIKLRKMGVRPGVADLVLLAPAFPAARLVAIELKAPKGRGPTDDQLGFKAAWEFIGGEYHVCRHVEEVEKIIEGMP
jgi:hypothetical protein